MLRWCLHLLNKDKLPNFTVEVFDDGTPDDSVRKVVSDYGLTLHESPPHNILPRPLANSRCGAIRHRITNHFIKCGDNYEYLVMLDGDVLVQKSTLLEAIEDIELILKCKGALPVGVMVLHSMGTLRDFRDIGDKRFCQFIYNGECAMIIPRMTISVLGNRFSSYDKGYCDAFWSALEVNRLCRYTRQYPNYNVQHIGLGKLGTTIFSEESQRVPWIEDLFKDRSGNYLQVDGFNCTRYLELVSQFGGVVAAQKLWEESTHGKDD